MAVKTDSDGFVIRECDASAYTWVNFIRSAISKTSFCICDWSGRKRLRIGLSIIFKVDARLKRSKCEGKWHINGQKAITFRCS